MMKTLQKCMNGINLCNFNTAGRHLPAVIISMLKS